MAIRPFCAVSPTHSPRAPTLYIHRHSRPALHAIRWSGVRIANLTSTSREITVEDPAMPITSASDPSRTLRKLNDLPGPHGLPLLGNALDLKPRELHRIISGWADRFGAMFVFRVATQKILTIADAEIIQKLLRDRPERYRRWNKIEQILVDIRANGLFSAEGANWRRQRKYVMHMLNASHVREFIPRFEQVAGRLRRR